VYSAVAGHLERAADAAGGHHDRLGVELDEPSSLPLVAEGPDHAAALGEQAEDRRLHVDVDALVDAVVLERSDHLEAGAVADMGQTRILVPAEVPLEDLAVARSIEHGAPRFELAGPVRGLLRVQLGHSPVVQVLPAAHRVGEVDGPAVAVVDVVHRRGQTALGHHGVRLAQQRLADEADPRALRGGLDRRPKTRAAGPDDQDVVLVSGVLAHAPKILRSVQVPLAHMKTYRSVKQTQKRLIHAQSMCRRLRQLTQSYVLRRAGRPARASKAPPTRCRSEWQPRV
jgi:hypothetical protein